MKDNAFVPCVGMICKDLYIRGITGSEYIGVSGFIENTLVRTIFL